MTATATLTRLEGERMLRHPALWLALPLVAWWIIQTLDEPWSGARYAGFLPALTPLLLGISLASASAFGRELVPVADAAPMTPARRSCSR